MNDTVRVYKEMSEELVASVQAAKTRTEADEATVELMRLEGLLRSEESRQGRILGQSTMAGGTKVAADTRPNAILIEARLEHVMAGLKKVKKIYEEKGWKF
tara:strand:+ start:330 stop:632 length:303 start_codon:yes stop_codon:yes gene_type:complete